MKPPADLSALIAAAIAAGRLRVIAEGVRGLTPPPSQPNAQRRPAIRPEACGAGRMLSRLPGLDTYDRARIS